MQSLFLLSLLPLALAAPAPSTAPVIEPRGTTIIPGKYIVKMKDGVNTTSVDSALSLIGSAAADHVYKAGAFKGFAGALDATTLSALQAHPDVRPCFPRRLEQSAVIRLS